MMSLLHILYEVQCSCSRHNCSHCALHVLHLEFTE